MTARRTISLAVLLASTSEGVTSDQLARAAGCSLRSANKHLLALVRDRVLIRALPPRKGGKRGVWRAVYRLRKENGGRSTQKNAPRSPGRAIGARVNKGRQ